MKKSVLRLMSVLMCACLLVAAAPKPALAIPNTLLTVVSSCNSGGTIYPSGMTNVPYGSNITYIFTADPGYELITVYVDGKEIGPMPFYTLSNVVINHVITAVFTPKDDGSSSTLPPIQTVPTPESYSDIASHWAHDSIVRASDLGLFSGTGDGKFSPDNEMTRGMLATTLWRMAGSPEPTKNAGFSDVLSGAWYYKAVNFCAEKGIVTGISQTAFDPDGIVTREQMAAMVFRYLKYMGKGPQGSWMINLEYTDKADISDYAFEGVTYCTMKGLFVGKLGNVFDPKGSATRAETAVVLVRLTDLMG